MQVRTSFKILCLAAAAAEVAVVGLAILVSIFVEI